MNNSRPTKDLSCCLLVVLLGFGTGCGSSNAPAPSAEPSPTSAVAANDAGQTNVRLSGFAQLITSSVSKLSLARNEKITIPVTVRNTSPNPWSSSGKAPITFSYRWLVGSEDKVLETARTLLPTVLPPGESITLNATIVAPAQPGTYTLRLSMVQEGIAWFIGEGAPGLDVPTVVR